MYIFVVIYNLILKKGEKIKMFVIYTEKIPIIAIILFAEYKQISYICTFSSMKKQSKKPL